MKNKKILIGWVAFGLIIAIGVLASLATHDWNASGIEFFFKEIFLDNFLAVNAILLGTMTLIGYLVLKRGWVESVLGFFKTAIGILILSIGSGILVSLAKPIFNGISNIGGGSNVVPLDPYLGWTSSNNFLESGLMDGMKIASSAVSWVSYALLIGFIFNIVLILFKKWTNVHTLMVTGHVMFQQTAILCGVVYIMLFRGVSSFVSRELGTIFITGIIIGTYWGVGSGSTLKGTQRVTNNAGFAIGHQQMFGISLAYKIGRFFGSKNNSAETRKVSKKFKIFEDNLFTQIIIIGVLFLILILIIQYATPGETNSFSEGIKGGKYASWNIQGGAYWIINLFLGILKLVASILVIVTGVRMFVTELQQSFQGISEKIIPGAVVAVDTAAVYGFAPNSVTFGFVSGVLGQFLAVGIVIGISVATDGAIDIVIPLFITLFFNSGSIGVFANASGGVRASIAVPFIFGFLEILVASGAVAMLDKAFKDAIDLGTAVNNSSLSPVSTGYIGMFDWNIFFGLQFLISGGTIAGAWITFMTAWVLMLLLAQITDNTMQEKQTFVQKMFKLRINAMKLNNESKNKKEEAKTKIIRK